jgi:hypothetical protein
MKKPNGILPHTQEEKHLTGNRIASHFRLDQTTESIEALAHIGGLTEKKETMGGSGREHLYPGATTGIKPCWESKKEMGWKKPTWNSTLLPFKSRRNPAWQMPS